MNYKLANGFYTNVTRHMNSLVYRGYDEDGKKILERIRYKPQVFLPSKETDTEWKTVDGIAVEPLEFESMSALRAFEKDYAGLAQYKVYGNTKHIPAFIQRVFPGKINYRRSLVDIANIDIETSYYADDGEKMFPDCDNPQNAIFTIAFKSSKSDKYIVWGVKDYDPSKCELEGITPEYRQFACETLMLEDFVEFWADPENTPDIITGWYSNVFDIPYIVGRCSHLIGEKETKRLSPIGKIERRETYIKGKKTVFFDIAGIASLDYMELFIKYAKQTYGEQESYKLDHIASVVLGDKKLDFSDIGSLKDLYDLDFQKYVDYNIKDVLLIERLEEKMGLLTLVMQMAYKGGVNYSDTLGTVAIWDSIIFRSLAKQKIAIPPARRQEKQTFPGGYVKDVIPGMYDDILSVDFASLYPKIMEQYNMSFDTVIHREDISMCPEKILAAYEDQSFDFPEGVCTAANGVVFRSDKVGTIPAIIKGLYEERKRDKHDMIEAEKELEKVGKSFDLESKIARLNTSQMAVKILMNSLFGACGNQHFRYYDIEIATAITLTGQTLIKISERTINDSLARLMKEDKVKVKDRVIAIDTDSCYINMSDITKKFKPNKPIDFLDEIGSKLLEPAFKDVFAKYAEWTGAIDNVMSMDREVIADRGIWTAKKRYILNVWDKEGVRYEKPKLKIMGLEAIKSSTPEICRDALRGIFNTILTGSEVEMQEEIKTFKKAFCASKTNEIGIPKGVSEVDKYTQKPLPGYTKGTPQHCRASILYNMMLKRLGIEDDYETIQNGDKMKYLFLKQPNPVNSENVIGFSRFLPEEMEIGKYIDYNTQFQKAYLDPLKLILDAINWKPEAAVSLESFFG